MEKIFIDEAVAEMRTVQDMVRWTVSQFNAAELFYGHGSDNAWDEALQLIYASLHLPLDSELALREARLTQRERQLLAERVQQRIEQRIPAAYLTQQAWFAGLPFYVDERVLVPRSPYAELIQKHFQPWLQQQPERILDLCTGSACIAIACAYAFPEAEVDAVDISEEALAVAEINIQQHGLEQQVTPLLSDGFTNLSDQRYDLIVSNPPYVDAEDMSNLPEEFQHEPELGLASGGDGLDLTRQILAKAVEHLNPQGLLFVEVGNSQVHLMEQFPELPLTWLEFEFGGHGVFVISREQLLAAQK